MPIPAHNELRSPCTLHSQARENQTSPPDEMTMKPKRAKPAVFFLVSGPLFISARNGLIASSPSPLFFLFLKKNILFFFPCRSHLAWPFFSLGGGEFDDTTMWQFGCRFQVLVSISVLFVGEIWLIVYMACLISLEICILIWRLGFIWFHKGSRVWC